MLLQEATELANAEVERLRKELHQARCLRKLDVYNLERLTSERDEYKKGCENAAEAMRKMEKIFIRHLEELESERDELKAELQLVREQTAKAARIMIEEAERVVARRAVEIAAEHYRLWLNEESKWGNRGFLSEAADVITDALREEFNLGQAQDSSPVGSETGKKHAQTAGNDK